MTGRLAQPRWLVAGGLLAAVGCVSARYAPEEGPAPGLTFPARFPDGESDASAPPSARPSASAVAEDAGPPRTGYLPDPPALRLARQWEYQVRYERGEVRVLGVTSREFPQPVVTARNIGRYAIELWIGHELVDRVRFDFPFVASEPLASGPRRPLKEPPSFARGAVVTRRVLVPASDRATRAVLLDRATGRTQALPWPPDAPLPAVDSGEPPVEPSAQVEDAGVSATDSGAVPPPSFPDAG